MIATPKTLHDFTLKAIDGKPMPLSQFKGKVVLLVNTASECGYTGQYEGLEQLWLANRDKGLVVVGVPSNDFGGQEPGTAGEIASFCKLNYGVTFPLSDKLVVKGGGADPLIQMGGREGRRRGPAQVELPQIPVWPQWRIHRLVFNPGQAPGAKDCGRGEEGAGGQLDICHPG